MLPTSSPTSPPTLPRRALGGDAQTITSTTLGFSDLFPTSTASSTSGSGNDGSSSGLGKSAPSLYLIIFLSILVVLLLTSTAIALRAIHLRRRFRSEIQRALARGSIHPWEAEELQRQREADAWGLGRWAGWGGWETDVAGGGGATGGQRQKKERKKLGPKPVMWEFELENEKEGLDEMNPFAIQTISPPSASSPQPSTLPFSSQTIYSIDNAFNPLPPRASIDETHLRAGRRLSINDEQFVPPGGGRGIAIRRNESRSRQRQGHWEVSTGRAISTVGRTTNEGDVEIPKAGENVQVGFIILMPEQDEMRREKQMLLNEEERSHGAMELGIWTGTVEDGRMEGREVRLEKARERFEDAGVV